MAKFANAKITHKPDVVVVSNVTKSQLRITGKHADWLRRVYALGAPCKFVALLALLTTNPLLPREEDTVHFETFAG